MKPEFEIDRASGHLDRVDRIDIKAGKFYEIKPNTTASIAEGNKQLIKYKEYLDKAHPRPGGWSGEVVTYNPATAKRIAKSMDTFLSASAASVLAILS